MISRNYIALCYTSQIQFQSRNRGSFDFKEKDKPDGAHRLGIRRFNLVIEVLLISSMDLEQYGNLRAPWFQSRNRGSFDFK